MQGNILKTTFFVVFALLLMANSCEDKKGKNETVDLNEVAKVEDANVKKTPLKFTFNGNYDDSWNKVDSLERRGQYKSALDIVESILTSAGGEKNTPNVVRAVIYRMKYNSYITEDDFIVSLAALDSISDSGEMPLKQIIHSLSAQVYWAYYQNNRWKFSNRTHTVNFDNKDIRTWDLRTLADQVNKQYLLSLTEKEELQRINIADFQSMLMPVRSNRELRPTLYDFLAHSALDFFETTEADLNRPQEKFSIQGSKWFGDAETFMNIPLSSTDTMSNSLHAAMIFQQLTKFHLSDKEPEALVDLELRRLKYVRSRSVEINKSQMYLDAIEKLESKYLKFPVAAELAYYKALYYYELGTSYSQTNEDVRWNKKKAVEICNLAITKFPNSFGAENCKSLLTTIQSKNVSFLSEPVQVPEDHAKILISYQNINKLHFRIVKVDGDYFFKDRYNYEEIVHDLVNKEVVEQWSKELTDPGDFQLHKLEVLLKPRDKGQYVILASHDPNFSLSANAIAYASFWVSRFNYLHRNNEKGESEIIVTDRKTGAPIKDVTAQIFTRKYNYNSRTYDIVKQESYRTDENGMITVNIRGDYRSVYVDLSKDDDRFNNGSQIYVHKTYNNKKDQINTYFYTDRAIYRPGQTVYFKGVRIKSNGEKHSIVPNSSGVVTFYDVNGQKVSDLKLTTNEYGTFSGQFKTPEGVLNGTMRIQDEYGSHYFSVEEYKRPKFEVEFEPVTGEYKLGQKIKVKGKAVAFAGSVVDGANVSFRITRGGSYSSWMWYRWGYIPGIKTVEITNGNVKTNELGEFEIEFEAKEDPTINRKYRPNYSYTISADVTDITGETRSSSKNVVVGVNAMTLSLQSDAYVDVLKPKKYKVNTLNLNGSKVNANVDIKVFKLIEPEGVYRNARWERPDMGGISEEDFKKYFPNEEFNKENDESKYERGEKVFDQVLNTESSDSVSFKGAETWAPGRYLIELSAFDSFGEEVKEIKYITVIDERKNNSPVNKAWTFVQKKVMCEPGENAEFLIASAVKGLKVFFEIEHKGTIVKKEWITLDNEQKLIRIPVEEKHRGNFVVHFTSVWNGMTFIQKETIWVPYSNKELDIHFETFRDKLLPGEKEEWAIRIKGPKGEKIAAELLAAMYDASLDDFAANNFSLNIYGSFYSQRYWSVVGLNTVHSQLYVREWNQYNSPSYRTYDKLNWWGYYGYSFDNYHYADLYYEEDGDFSGRNENISEIREVSIQTVSKGSIKSKPKAMADGLASDEAEFKANKQDKNNEIGLLGFSQDAAASGEVSEAGNSSGSLKDVKARSNLNETAFFYPQLKTDVNGDVLVRFTAPEALTRWKVIGLAHTKDLKIGHFTKEVVTQKELMVMPNTPRFFREGDKIFYTAKVSNISYKDLNGTSAITFYDALTNTEITKGFVIGNSQQEFVVQKGQSALLKWELTIPEGYSAVKCKIVAKAMNHSDGEEVVVPILSNRMLVTESLPLPSRGKGVKEFKFEKLIESGNSSTLKHHKVTLEYSSNPAWYAVQALPYMMEYPHECAEQMFSRYYANALATHIVASNPKIKEVFKQWENSSPEAFLSNLEKNQELKSVILQETPWVMDAQNESERKKRIALLFDLHKMERELNRTLTKLTRMQVSNGGFPWFTGMRDNRYISQHIITGLGHLDNLGVKDVRENNATWKMVQSGVRYLDERILEDYVWIRTHVPGYLHEQMVREHHIQYLYARSYFKDIPLDKKCEVAFKYFQDQAEKYWKNFNIYNEGMIALQANRFGNKDLANIIMVSLKERSIEHEEMGMYWKDNVAGYYWYQAPIETQALLIEAFDEISNDAKSVEDMKVWLLKQKQTTDWKTTKATAEACYALFLRGTDMLTEVQPVKIKMNGVIIDPVKEGAKVEAGTGYFKTSWSGEKVKPGMGNISVERSSEGVSWGAVYWQYFEDLDKITTHETPLKLSKKLFLVENTASGPVMKPILDNTVLKPGDKVKVRIELRTDRDMEYVHMKDMRASTFEPVNVFSQYKWQDGLGYYESTGDAATNFFMDYMSKGTYVFEYELRVTHYGEFSNGITTIQCMYAPEFTSHSEGIHVVVSEEKK